MLNSFVKTRLQIRNEKLRNILTNYTQRSLVFSKILFSSYMYELN